MHAGEPQMEERGGLGVWASGAARYRGGGIAAYLFFFSCYPETLQRRAPRVTTVCVVRECHSRALRRVVIRPPRSSAGRMWEAKVSTERVELTRLPPRPS